MRVIHRTQPSQAPGRITRTATQARGGEIVLGRRGRWIWIGTFAVIFLVAIFALWVR